MYEQAEPVRSPFSGPDSPQPSGPPPQPSPVQQSGSRGCARHGNGDSDKQREDQDTSSHTYENAEEAKRYATSADGAYPGGTIGRRGVCSFLHARRSCLAAGIAVLLSLVAMGLAPLTFSNKQEILQLKRDQDGMSTTADALKSDQDALKRDQDGMSITVDDVKRDLDNERSRIATLEQRLHKIEKTLRYTMWREICYKAFNTPKSFSDAAAACRTDGGTLAMPRGADTNAFIISLYKSVHDDCPFWFGLHDQNEEGTFEWVDGSAFGPYNSWAPREPNDVGRGEDCVSYYGVQREAVYFAYKKDKWNDIGCHRTFPFICQAAPESWVLTKKDLSRLEAAEMRVVRTMLGKSRLDKIRNTHLRNMLGITSVVDDIERSALRWLGHVQRMNPDRIPKMAFDLKLKGKRPPGRPRKRWRDNVQEILTHRRIGRLERLEEEGVFLDRKEWKRRSELTGTKPTWG
ncbi:hypothetical protein Bbelb_302820 [Branchiostoma belcheri]|nr:hypothetical protein Bbelb_302820 [Branchiostoma belcheri]